jgi:hypothetical protein
MKRLAVIFVLLTSSALGQTLLTYGAGGGGTVALSWSGTASLIAVTCGNGVGGDSGTPSDTKGLTWHDSDAAGQQLYSWYAYGSFTGSDTVSCADTSDDSITVQVWGGTLTTSNPFDGSSNNDNSGYDPGSVSPSQAGDVFIATWSSPETDGLPCGAVSPGTIATFSVTSATIDQGDGHYVNSGSSAVDMVFSSCGDDPLTAEANMVAFKKSIPQASSPSCTPTSGVVPQTVTCTNPNSGTTVMCYAASPTVPATNGVGTGCTTGTAYTIPLVIASPETLNVIAGTSLVADSNLVSYTYTSASVKRHRASVTQR